VKTAMSLQFSCEAVSVKGQWVTLPAVKVREFTLIISGKFLKTAAIKNEFFETEEVTDPLSLITALKKSKPKADIFTFSQKIPDSAPKFGYYYELDNVAAIPISTFDNWWNNQINSDRRKMIRRASKRGVEVRLTPFDDNLVKGITEIYNEAPFRQGKRFWHYGKDFETVKKETATYCNRSEFIGAYCQDELIGFIKIVDCGKSGNMTLILAKLKDRDKDPMDALVAKAVEVCAQKGMSFLTYGKYVYGKKGEDTLTEFKRRCGFERIDIPNYFIPLTAKGNIAVRLGFHHYPHNLLPDWLLKNVIKFRSKWSRRLK
jgi:hypothetical protein